MQDYDRGLSDQDEKLRCFPGNELPYKGGLPSGGIGGYQTSPKCQEITPVDPIYSPEHYTRRNPQPLEVIEAWGLDFWLGQVVKYVGRAGYKAGSTELEDLKKARFYLDRKIAILKGGVSEQAKAL